MSDSVTIRVSAETRDRINKLTQYGTQDVIIAYLLDQNDKYDLFKPGWARELAQDQLQDILSDADIEFRKKVEFANHKARLKTVQRVFDAYLKTLPLDEKRDWLENILGNTRSTNFLENMTSYQMFIVDGLKRLLLPLDDGFPRIPGIPRDRVISCDRGFHIINSRCECRYWNECELGSAQYEDWLSQYGTELQKKQYLEESTGQRYFVRSRRRGYP